jgi:penicillin-binding protein 1C
LGALMAGVVAACALIVWQRSAMPSFEDVVQKNAQGSHTCLLARDGQVLSCERRAQQSGWQAPWQSLAEFPDELKTLVIASEDRRFWQHTGVDAKALAASVMQSPWKRRGASTLSMQTARLILGRQDLPSTLWGKLRQMDAAWALERRWSKAQILEAYLNLAPLRGNVRGFHTAQKLWLHNLRADQQIQAWPLLVAMVPAPQASPAMLGRRSCLALQSMASHCSNLSAEQWQGWEQVWRSIFNQNSSFAGIESAQNAIYSVAYSATQQQTHQRSTLDARQQTQVIAHLHQGLRRLQDADVSSAAAVLIDNASGEVLAHATVHLKSSGIDIASRPRTLASTLKPFLYAQALDAKLLKRGESIRIRGRVFRQGSCDERDYKPRDSVALERAQVQPALGLAASSNVAAVDMVTRVSPEVFHERLQALGVLPAAGVGNGCNPKPRYGHALALGSASGSLLHLTNAYRSLANGGEYSPARLWMDQAPAKPAQRLFSTSSAAWVSDALSNQKLRFEGFGPDNPLDTPYWSASKTGTSDGYRDNWALGYTRTHTLGVWVGNADGSAMRGVFGPDGAAPIWRAVMDGVQKP